MKIVVLDRASMGFDTPFSALDRFGEVVYYDNSTNEEVAGRIADADVIILNKIRITRSIMESSKNLKLICVFATGFDNIDIIAARELEIAVCNVPGYSTDSVVLYTIATVLGLSARLYEYNEFVRSGEYSRSGAPNRLTPVYHEINGKVWGIVGYGNIGRAVGRVAESLGAKVLVNKRNPQKGVTILNIDDLCRECDIITIHCPLNDESRNLINKERIALMKPGVILVNEARGAVLDEEAVAEAVELGKIGAFGCDVYSQEPFSENHPYDRIKNLPNVILTPHSAWGAYEARKRCINMIAENIEAFNRGKILNRVDK